jgi:hypothetical protein
MILSDAATFGLIVVTVLRLAVDRVVGRRRQIRTEGNLGQGKLAMIDYTNVPMVV